MTCKIKVHKWSTLEEKSEYISDSGDLKFCDGSVFVVDMKMYCGEVIDVNKIKGNSKYAYHYDGWNFSKVMCEPFKEMNRNGANS